MLAQVNQALENEKQQLAVTLRSIADGVISTDETGLITFINSVAERLTGYLEKEALGKPINEVMNLRDAQTSEAMLNPALDALEVKRPVAMAYNTTLISRHGYAFRVEDTASPIIDDKGKLHQLSLSIGISLFPQDASNAEEMMRHADTAMYRSKTKGKDAFSFFSKDLQLAMHRRVELEILLRNAIENNQLAILLQPKYSFADRSVVGAESLVRLYDENGKVIGPDEFIPLAEETGLIHQLGYQVLKKSCVLVAECHKRGQALKLAVNVAAKQLANPRFAKEVEQIITATGIDASMIELEVTESALMHDFEQTKDMLNALTSLGVSIALDDFGTGYSSLSYLRQFPLDVLKIDRSFVIDMDQEQQAFDIVSAIVQLALSLDLKIVAAGIENEAQFEALEKLGCHLGQGYLLCKPIAVDEFLVYFANTQPIEKVFY